MQRFITCAIGGALVLLSGCTRAKVTTEIRPNGSFVRTVEITGPAKQEGMTTSPPIEEMFALPAGPAWKRSENSQNGDRVLTLSRTVAPGGNVKGDLSLKGVIANEATVARLGPKRLEYREQITWSGTAPASLAGVIKPEDVADMQKALPKELATEENAKALIKRTSELAVPVLFGPGDPLLSIGLIHPELAARRMSQRIGGLLVKALEEQFGDRLSREQRLAIARKLVESMVSTARPSRPDPAAGPPSGGDNKGLVPLMFVLKGPAGGKLISSNGEQDEFTGEVFWALFPEASSFGPVSLKAVWELK